MSIASNMRVGPKLGLGYVVVLLMMLTLAITSMVRGSANALSSASEEVSATAQSMSQASSEQTASVEETSASVEQMSDSIEQNTKNAGVTDSVAGNAYQTNLLALNSAMARR